ncbi:ABC transporter ATP-binding protein [Bosea sp. 117]|uniref:ABC transporter ATP-binding protein n=1 Tax=Bosea sp. 117 TaxID=1125973 RepID=UPI00056EBED2|nr:ABC transporter ATP-binding protein [Bosea sp. 117]
MTATSPLLSFSGIDVVFPGGGTAAVTALKNISLDIKAGEFVSLIGPSGCGKSTLLRVAADLIGPSAGVVRIDGRPPDEMRRQREIGFVFQDAALLEWRRILANVALPLELQGVARDERLARARALLDLVGIAGFENAWPRQLSGGMRQRAAIARAMSTSPRVMLMDEPFGALDQITRDRLNLELSRIAEREAMTVVFVTHSIQEAVFLSDRVVVMTPRPGRITRVIDVDLPHPRQLDMRGTERFIELCQLGERLLSEGFDDSAH